MFAVIAGLVWYRVDQHITTSGEVSYPFNHIGKVEQGISHRPKYMQHT
jgi:hypothetical protein